MSYNSRKTIVNMAAGIVLVVAYLIYALGSNAPAPEDLQSWATAMLVFIGIGIAAIIVIQILFHIAFAIGVAIKEGESSEENVERVISSSMVEDEREKLIGLKSSVIGYVCAGVGFIAALVALALGSSALIALHILFGTSILGSLVEGAVSVYLDERGVHHG
jgi:hypothetical protein